MKQRPLDFKKIVREELELNLSGNYPVRDCMEEAWGFLFDYYRAGPYGLDGVSSVVSNRADGHTVDNPFLALMTCVEDGFYPPPEILLAVLRCYELYLSGYGDLEECLLGPRKRKGGSYARRHAIQERNAQWLMRVDALEKNGLTAMQAAEVISAESPGGTEPETILRTISGLNNAFALYRKISKFQRKAGKSAK